MTRIDIDLSELSGVDPETINLAKASIDFSPFIAYEYEDGEWLTRNIRKAKCPEGVGTIVLPPTPTGKGYEVQERGFRGVRHGYIIVPDQAEINYSDLQWVTKASLDPVTPPDPAWLLAWQGTQDQLDELSETVSELELELGGKADQTALTAEASTRSNADALKQDISTLSADTAAHVSDASALDVAVAAKIETVGDLLYPHMVVVSTTGTADDRGPLVAADTEAQTNGRPILLRPGTYAISSSVDIASPVIMQAGAILKPANGATVRLRGGVEAPRRQIFDHSLGGIVAPQKVDFYHPAWWGTIGTADDTATWQAMNSALVAGSVTQSSVPFCQRILAPAGLNRINGLVLANCDVVADKGSVVFAPPVAATSGTMLRINDYVTLHGGYYTTTHDTQAVLLIDHRGYRSQIDNAYVVPSATSSIGINLGDGTTITPVLNDCRIIGGTKATGSRGLVVNSADAQITNLWVATCEVGIEWLRGVANVANLHVWGCVTGMTGVPDGSLMVNVFLDSNDGWGADFTNLDRAMITNLCAWNNGAVTASTGGMRVTRTGGLSCANTTIVNATIDDNTGTGLLLDGVIDYTLDDVRVMSRSVQAGGAAIGNIGVQIAAASLRTHVNVRGGKVDVLTAVLDDLSATSRVDMGEVKKVLTADVAYTNTTTATSLFNIPIRKGEKWLIDGVLIVDGPQSGDFKARLQATSATGVTGWFSMATATAGSTSSSTAASLNPSNVQSVLISGGTYQVAGLVGAGTKQAIVVKGYVATASVDGALDLQATQSTADLTATTVYAGSWVKASRIN